MIRTARVKNRRSLRFGRMEDILRDVECLDAAQSSGAALRALGNWTPAQIVDHITKLIIYSMDGFPEPRAGLLLRMAGKLLRDRALLHPMRPGLRFPRRFAPSFSPDSDVTWPQAVARLRAAIERIDKGDRMTVPSPVLGPLVHEEWIQLHCRHAEMHLSFILPPGGSGES